MNKKAKVIEALNMTISGLSILRDIVEEEYTSSEECIKVENCEPIEPKTESVPEEVPNVIPMEEVVSKKEAVMEEPVATTNYSEEELRKMKYNDLKKVCADLGLKNVGTRNELVGRVLELQSANESTEEQVVEEEKPVEEKKTDSEPEYATEYVAEPSVPTEESVEGDTTEPKKGMTMEEALALATELTEDMTASDIKAELAEVDIKTKARKKETLVKELAKALAEGVIEVEMDEEPEDSTPEATETEDTTEVVEDVVEESTEEPVEEVPEETPVVNEKEAELEVSPTAWNKKYDLKGWNNPEEMSDEREESCIQLISATLEAIENGEYSKDDVEEYLTINTNEEEKALLETLSEDDEEEMVAFLAELLKRTVDDEGEVHDPSDPYEVTINDEVLNFCCGHELRYDPVTENYICEICGEEYESE